jgi:hypothetical protein
MSVIIGTVGRYCMYHVPGVGFIIEGHLPSTIYGPLALLVLLVNPLLRRIRASWAFRPKEIAVVVAMVLVACSIPNSGLMRYFPPDCHSSRD